MKSIPRHPTLVPPASGHPAIAAPARTAAASRHSRPARRYRAFLVSPDDLDRTMTMVAVGIVAIALLATTLGLAFALFVG